MRFEEMINKVHCVDCLEFMREIPDNCVDLVLTDPPYGTTACEWDSIIPLEPMWEQLKRITKDNSAIVLTASQPFTTALISSNIKMFRQTLTWVKNKPMNFMNANKMFMKWTEDVCVFYDKLPTYNPQMIKGAYHKNGNKEKCGNITQYSKSTDRIITESEYYYPSSIINLSLDHKTKHPTEKPVKLMGYLIKTYSNKNDIVLDFTVGSGTTAVAAKQLGRRFIGCEISPEYCKIAEDRLRQEELFS